jgi:hypothetical protein
MVVINTLPVRCIKSCSMETLHAEEYVVWRTDLSDWLEVLQILSVTLTDKTYL